MFSGPPEQIERILSPAHIFEFVLVFWFLCIAIVLIFNRGASAVSHHDRHKERSRFPRKK